MVINGNSKILSVGVSLPDNIVPSVSLMEEIKSEKRFGIPHNWIDTRVGIINRRYVSSDTKPSDLAIEASIKALSQANINPEYLDLIIYCGIDRDYVEPSTAHVVQYALSSKAICMDISNACQGMISGMSVADAMISSGAVESVLICSGETPSKVVKQFIKQINEQNDDYMRDRLGMLTAGDAGSAMIITRKKENDPAGIQKMLFDSRGQYAEYCYYKHVGNEIEGQMLMKGITDTIGQIHLEMISNTYHYLDWQPENVDFLACHQVGKKSHQGLCQMAEVSESKAPITYKEYGNTTSATIPLCIDIAKPKINDKILFIGGGSGLSSYQGGVIW